MTVQEQVVAGLIGTKVKTASGNEVLVMSVLGSTLVTDGGLIHATKAFMPDGRTVAEEYPELVEADVEVGQRAAVIAREYLDELAAAEHELESWRHVELELAEATVRLGVEADEQNIIQKLAAAVGNFMHNNSPDYRDLEQDVAGMKAELDNLKLAKPMVGRALQEIATGLNLAKQGNLSAAKQHFGVVQGLLTNTALSSRPVEAEGNHLKGLLVKVIKILEDARKYIQGNLEHWSAKAAEEATALLGEVADLIMGEWGDKATEADLDNVDKVNEPIENAIAAMGDTLDEQTTQAIIGHLDVAEQNAKTLLGEEK